MRNILSILFLLFTSLLLKAQIDELEIPVLPVDEDTKLITYKGIVSEKGSKDELYDRALAWYNKFYKNPTDVLRNKDKEEGMIKGIARLPIYNEEKGIKTQRGNIEYTIITEFKDGRYRYTIINFNLKQTSYFPLEKWLNPKDPNYTEKNNPFIVQIDAYINELIDNLRQAMKPVEKKKDNW